jgi:hypothetical protein
MADCTDKVDGTSKFVKFIHNVPSIVQGSDTLIAFVEGNLSNFYQQVDGYHIHSFVLGANGSTTTINQDMNFILAVATWPTVALESEKILELQLTKFDPIGGTGPLGATGLSTELIPIKDIFMLNSEITHEHLQFTNNSLTQTVTINLLTAK